MERDFMGLNSKDSVVVVKEEFADEGCKDSAAFFKGPQVHWPPPNTINFSSKCQSAETQRKINQNREGGTHFTMTTYPIQQSEHPVLLPHDVKVLPGSNQGVSLSVSHPFFKTQFSGAAQNFLTASTMPHFLGGVPIAHPSISSMAGTTDSWSKLKDSQASAPLTIFYGGTVNVFENISPEKAQAIMFLAGNASAANVGQPRHQAQTPVTKLVAEDVVYVKQPVSIPPSSGLSSPISVSSHPVSQSANNDGTAKISAVSTTSINKVEGPKMATPLGPLSAPTMIQSAVPQARKASLARFLEKRKERVMNSAPYNNLTKKTAECATP